MGKQMAGRTKGFVAVWFQGVKGPGPGQVFQRPFIDCPWVHPSGKIKQIFIRTVFQTFLHHRLHGAAANIAHRPQGINNFAIFDGKIRQAAVNIRAAHLHPLPTSIQNKAGQLVRIGDIQAHQGGQQFNRVMGFQPGGLIRHQRISGRVRFVKPIAGKLVYKIKDIFGLIILNAIGHRAGNKTFPLCLHFRFDLFTHRPAQQIGFAQRIPRQHLGNLHHLFLVNDHPIGFRRNMGDLIMQKQWFFVPMLAGRIFGNVFHRAWPIEGHDCDNIFKTVWPGLAQYIAHTRTFQLENPHRLGPGKQIIGFFIIQRQIMYIHLDTPRRQKGYRPVDHRQGFKAQKVKFDQSAFFRPFHIELCCRHIRARITIKR